MGVHSRRERSVAGLALVLATTMAAGTFVQYAVGPLGPFLVDEFGWSRAQLGSLLTALFLAAAVTSGWLGRFTDRAAERQAVGMAFGVSIAALAIMGLAPGYAVMLVAMVVAGFSQALVNPLTNSIVVRHASPQRQGLVLGLKQAGVQAGGVVAGGLLPWMATTAGWRAGVGVAAVLLLVALGAVVFAVPRSPAASLPTHADQASGQRARMGRLTWYAFMMGSGAAVVGAHLPLFANERVGMGAAEAGTLLAMVAFGGVVARVLFGFTGDRVARVDLLLRALSLASAAGVLLLVAAPAGGPLLAWVGAAVFGAGVGWNAVAMLAVVRAAGGRATGHASGVVMTGFFGGFIFAPVAFGALVDATGNYAAAWLAVAAMMAAAAAVPEAQGRSTPGTAAAPSG